MDDFSCKSGLSDGGSDLTMILPMMMVKMILSAVRFIDGDGDNYSIGCGREN